MRSPSFTSSQDTLTNVRRFSAARSAASTDVQTSRTRVVSPKRCAAASRAASGLMPRAMWSRVRCSMWKRSSSSTSCLGSLSIEALLTPPAGSLFSSRGVGKDTLARSGWFLGPRGARRGKSSQAGTRAHHGVPEAADQIDRRTRADAVDHRARDPDLLVEAHIGPTFEDAAAAPDPENRTGAPASRAERGTSATARRRFPASPYHLAYIHTGLGNVDRAIDYPERAIAEGSGTTFSVKGSFLSAPLREHARFKALLASIGAANATSYGEAGS